LVKWECFNCGYLVEALEPPLSCPTCGALRKAFTERREILTPLDEPVKEYMIKEIYILDKKDTALKAVKTMREKGVSSVFVGEKDKIIGIITEKDLINKVLAKDLKASEVKLEDIMSSPVVSVESKVLVREALQIMAKNNFRRLLVVEDNKPIGLITERFIVGEREKEAKRTQRFI